MPKPSNQPSPQDVRASIRYLPEHASVLVQLQATSTSPAFSEVISTSDLVPFLKAASLGDFSEFIRQHKQLFRRDKLTSSQISLLIDEFIQRGGRIERHNVPKSELTLGLLFGAQSQPNEVSQSQANNQPEEANNAA